MTFITHEFRVLVVSDVRERVQDLGITFALYVKKIFIRWVCKCVTRNVLTMPKFFFIHQYVKPCLSKNPKYTLYTIKSSLTLAYKPPGMISMFKEYRCIHLQQMNASQIAPLQNRPHQYRPNIYRNRPNWLK
jgi:hypothetical protein